MFNFSKDRLSLANYACGILALIMLVLQFLPFWSFDYIQETKVAKETEVPVETAVVETTEETAAEEDVAAEATTDEEEPVAEESADAVVETKKVTIEEILTEERSTDLSIASYIWFTTSDDAVALKYQHIPSKLGTPVPAPPVADGVKQEIVEGSIVENDIVLQPVLQFVFALIVLVLSIVKTKSIFIPALTTLSSIFGIYAYLTNPVMQIGNMWQLHLAVCFVMIVVGLIASVFKAQQMIKGRKERLAFLENKSLTKLKEAAK